MEKRICDRCNTENTPNANYCAGCGYRLPDKIEEKVEESPAQKSNSNIQKQIFTIVGVLISFLMMWGVQKFVFAKPSIDKAMVEFASVYNKNCPMMVDKLTRLDNMVVLPNKTLQYNYTLIDWVKEEIDTLELKKTLSPQILNFAKTNPQLKYVRDNKITLNYYYKDKNGNYVCMISVTPDKYN